MSGPGAALQDAITTPRLTNATDECAQTAPVMLLLAAAIFTWAVSAPIGLFLNPFDSRDRRVRGTTRITALEHDAHLRSVRPERDVPRLSE